LRVHIWNYNTSTDIPLNKKPKLIRSFETFVSENGSIAIPWPGVERAKPDVPNSSDPSSRCFFLGTWFFPLGPAVTWPEEKLLPNIQCNLLEKLGSFVISDMGAWSAGILTAGHDGIIRSFHNYGLPSGVGSNLKRVRI
jgi:WD repeat-containing protein 44